jgi:cytochrome c biogenesis protein CcmG/thiol:disulfide interchange protein DsbE
MSDMSSVRKSGLKWKVPILVALVALPVLLGIGLTRDPSHVPSALVGQKVPEFNLNLLEQSGALTNSEFGDTPLIINFWASWCATCRQEHPKLVELGIRSELQDEFEIVGVNYRDSRDRAQRFLDREGHFGYRSGFDERGRLGIDFGVYGMPETFFVDRDGVIQARHAGPVTDAVLAKYLPLIGVTP